MTTALRDHVPGAGPVGPVGLGASAAFKLETVLDSVAVTCDRDRIRRVDHAMMIQVRERGGRGGQPEPGPGAAAGPAAQSGPGPPRLAELCPATGPGPARQGWQCHGPATNRAGPGPGPARGQRASHPPSAGRARLPVGGSCSVEVVNASELPVRLPPSSRPEPAAGWQPVQYRGRPRQ